MGIEAIGSIGRVASAVPAKVAMTPRAQLLAREFSPIRITRIEAPKPQMRVADVIAEAEAIMRRSQTQTKQSIKEIVTLPSVVRNDIWRESFVRLPNINPLPKAEFQPVPALKVEPQVRVQPATDTKPVTMLKRMTAPVPETQSQTEQVIEETVKVEEKQEDKTKSRRSEKVARVMIQLVEAINISEKRRAIIKAAIKQAKAEIEKSGLKGITGKLVAKLLSSSFWVHKSPIVGEGRDGTLPLTVYELVADTTKYKNEEEAEAYLVQAVAKHIPVKEGEGGRQATMEEVMEVIEGKRRSVIEDKSQAKLVVTKRELAKNEVARSGQVISSIAEEKEEITGEPTLKTLGLEDLVPKAA